MTSVRGSQAANLGRRPSKVASFQGILAGLAGSLVLATAAPADAQPLTEPSAMTQHRITVAGKPLAYTAEAGRIAIRDAETGAPRGWMYYTAYRVASPRRPEAAASRRARSAC